MDTLIFPRRRLARFLFLGGNTASTWHNMPPGEQFIIIALLMMLMFLMGWIGMSRVRAADQHGDAAPILLRPAAKDSIRARDSHQRHGEEKGDAIGAS